MSTKLIMVTGVQRSGTSALFYSLAEDRRLACFQESADSEVFLRWNLRPEKEIRSVLKAGGRPVLMKPTNETAYREVSDLCEEYRDYDLSLVWIFRDPVNVFSSTLEWYSVERKANNPFYDSLCGRPDPFSAADEFVEIWNCRNLSFLRSLGRPGLRAALVKYEDLIADPRVFDGLCVFLGVEGRSKFLGDSLGGYRRFPAPLRRRLRRGTADVFDRLMEARTFQPQLSAGRRLGIFLKRQLAARELRALAGALGIGSAGA